MNEVVETPGGLSVVRDYVVGQKITENGMYDMPITSYHGDCCDAPSISSSGLRTIFGESPAHYFVNSPYNEEREPEEPNPAFIMGRATHHLFLGEKDFRKTFVIRPDKLEDEKGEEKEWHGSRNVCKKWMADRAAEGVTVLSGEMVKHIRGMAKSIEEHPFAKDLLRGQIERSLIYKDPATGIWVKSRPDAIPNDDLDFGDLKNTTSVEYEDIERTIFNFGYHQQGALVRSACRTVLGMDMNTFNLVFVEKTPPYCVRVFTLKPEMLDLGQEQNEVSIRYFKKCMDSGYWPGPGGTQTDASYVGIPSWAEIRTKNKILMLHKEVEGYETHKAQGTEH